MREKDRETERHTQNQKQKIIGINKNWEVIKKERKEMERDGERLCV